MTGQVPPVQLTEQPPNLLDDLRNLLHRASREAVSGTPDYMLAEFMVGALEVFERVTVSRDAWWGNTAQIAREPKAGAPHPDDEF